MNRGLWWILVLALLAWTLVGAHRAVAQELSVPVGMQVALVDKVAAYDKNFAARVGEHARVIIVTMRGDADSARMAVQLKAAFAEVGRLGGVAHEESILEFTDAHALAALCREQRLAIVYLTAGLARELDAIGKALDGVSVLTVGAVGGYAARGAVIDFFVEGGKPKIALNLSQARKQQVAFTPEVVRIMRVIE